MYGADTRADKPKRSKVKRTAGILLAISLLFGGLNGVASARPNSSWGTPEFSECEKLQQDSQWAKARSTSEAMLARNRHDFGALYLLGRVHFVGEGSLPRASYYFDEARRELEKGWGKRVPTNGPWKLHAAILRNQILVRQQMEDYKGELALIKEFNKIYRPPLLSMEGWPLLKLGRIEEARRKLKLALDSCPADDWDQRSAILNSLGNVEFETEHMALAYKYFAELMNHFENATPENNDPVYWGNAAEAARSMLLPDLAEKHWLAATRHFNAGTYGDPWKMLAELYLSQARYPEAIQALKEMQAWRLSCSPQVAQNKWADCLSTSGIVLFGLGYDEEALAIFDRLIDRPDRNSGISTKASLMTGRLYLIHSLILGNCHQRKLEERSFSDWQQWPSLSWQLFQLSRRQTLSQAQASSLIALDSGLKGFLKPYGSISLDRPWLLPATVSVFGPGPIQAAVQQRLKDLDAQKDELATPVDGASFDPQAERPYLLAVSSEALNAQGDYPQAEKLLNQCLEVLPPREAGLRHRVQANLIVSLEGQSKNQEALHYYQRIMESDPSLLRQLGLRLPIQWSSSGSLGDVAAGRLAGSPRFREQRSAFAAKVTSDSSGISGIVTGPDGAVLKRIRIAATKDPDLDLIDFCRSFHDQLFSPVIDLSQSDIYSIDSSPQAASAKDLEKILK